MTGLVAIALGKWRLDSTCIGDNRKKVLPAWRSPCPLLAVASAALLVVLGHVHASGTEETICLEAESAIVVTPPMRVVSATNVPLLGAAEVSGGGWLEVPQGSGNPPKIGGEAIIRFEVRRAGQYDLWCRVWWDDECGNSLTMVVDEGKPFVFGQDSTFKCWHWVRALRLKQLFLEPGVHTLKIQNREDGVRIDQILFTLNPKYVPVGIENVTRQESNQ